MVGPVAAGNGWAATVANATVVAAAAWLDSGVSFIARSSNGNRPTRVRGAPAVEAGSCPLSVRLFARSIREIIGYILPGGAFLSSPQRDLFVIPLAAMLDAVRLSTLDCSMKKGRPGCDTGSPPTQP